jgi:hypothetical protein
VEANDVGLVGDLLALLADGLVELLLGLVDDLLDPGGWIRPSWRSFWSDRRASSRRSGSNAETVMTSGVSSTIRSTPVACSRARMLRPSRPMMRPFMSSLGSGTTDTVDSAT